MNKAASTPMPLAGVKGSRFSYLRRTFRSTILAEFGAEVVWVEQPGTGDLKFGTAESGDSQPFSGIRATNVASRQISNRRRQSHARGNGKKPTL